MTDITDRLRAAALVATPGPWEAMYVAPWQIWAGNLKTLICSFTTPQHLVRKDWTYPSLISDITEEEARANALLVAAASPDVILALLDELDTLRDEAERLRIRVENDAIRLRGMADCASGEL
jgi:hypothetical protein